MRRLIQADIDRILRRKALWFLVIATFLIITSSIFDSISKAPDKGFGFAVAASDGISYIGLLAGLFLILNIYADDFKSMAFINVVGRGISRGKLIIAKYIDTILIMVNIYIVSGFLTVAMKFITGTRLSPTEIQFIVLRFISDMICTISGVVVAAVFFYMTENAVLGVVAYIFCQVIIPIALHFINLVPWITKYHPERIFISGAASMMMTDFMLGNILGGIGLLLLVTVVYIGVPMLITILLFNKKELDF